MVDLDLRERIVGGMGRAFDHSLQWLLWQATFYFLDQGIVACIS